MCVCKFKTKFRVKSMVMIKFKDLDFKFQEVIAFGLELNLKSFERLGWY